MCAEKESIVADTSDAIRYGYTPQARAVIERTGSNICNTVTKGHICQEITKFECIVA
jgi:hypothetical protein